MPIFRSPLCRLSRRVQSLSARADLVQRVKQRSRTIPLRGLILLRRVHTAGVTERQARLRRDNASLEDARSVARRLCALHFIETFDDTISLQPGEPIDPKDPIELIDLVLETYGEQTIGLFDLFHAAQILVGHPQTGMAFDLFRYARHGDAAFLVPDYVGGSPDDLRVDVHPHSIRRCEFDHGQPLQNADMGW